MLKLIFLRFWPVFLPLALYFLWLYIRKRKAEQTNAPPPKLKDGPWVWAVAASLLIFILCFIILGLTGDGADGRYIPAHQDAEGNLVPARIVPIENTVEDTSPHE